VASEPEDPAGAVFGALSDPTRRDLLAAIAQRPETTATELAAHLPISRQAVLKHLTALAQAGLLDRERSGREVRYRVTPGPLSEAVSWMAQVGGQWDGRLAALSSQFGARAESIAAGARSAQGTGASNTDAGHGSGQGAIPK
jgi:DNA-binding transcriptional ArsR family regulator